MIDYPNWRIVRYYYDIWVEEDDDGISLLDHILRKLVEMNRKNNDRSEKNTILIVDSKSVQNAGTVQSKGYDAEKTSEIKLHIGVDTRGLPHAIMITAANFTDRKGAIDMVSYYRECTDNLSQIKKCLLMEAIQVRILLMQY